MPKKNNIKNSKDFIIIKGARVHNLKNIDVEIPRNKLVVITGLSGSGKSSLAFDTIYAEGQRRYVESLSSYARQFLGLMDKPDVDSIEGLGPAISIDQRSVSHNPRSTVGTTTEIYDYLRLLFARIGKPHCPKCGDEISKQSVDQIVSKIFGIADGKKHSVKIALLAPIIRDKKGEHKNVLEEIRKVGYVRVRFDGIVYPIEEAIELSIDKMKKHNLEVVVDRLEINPKPTKEERSRLSESLETVLDLGNGLVKVFIVDGDGRETRKEKIENRKEKRAPQCAGSPPRLPSGDSAPKNRDDDGPDGSSLMANDSSPVTSDEILFSQHFSCPKCDINLPEIEPRSFSFNSPYGACSVCSGIGAKLEVDPDLVIPNKNLTIAEGAIRPWSRISANQGWYF